MQRQRRGGATTLAPELSHCAHHAARSLAAVLHRDTTQPSAHVHLGLPGHRRAAALAGGCGDADEDLAGSRRAVHLKRRRAPPGAAACARRRGYLAVRAWAFVRAGTVQK